MQLSREIFSEKYSDLSVYAKWLFVALNENEQKFTGDHEDFFFRSDIELARDAGMSIATLKRAKAELLKHTDLVQSWQTHFVDKKTGIQSEKHITAYRILK